MDKDIYNVSYEFLKNKYDEYCSTGVTNFSHWLNLYEFVCVNLYKSFDTDECELFKKLERSVSYQMFLYFGR